MKTDDTHPVVDQIVELLTTRANPRAGIDETMREQIVDLLEDNLDQNELPEALSDVAAYAAHLREGGAPRTAEALAQIVISFDEAVSDLLEVAAAEEG